MFENSNIDGLANYLDLARLIRKQECNHVQIDQTKLIYSKFNNFGVQLYTVEYCNNKYSVRKLEENEITVWMYNPDLTHIVDKIQNLYSNLKPMSSFANTLDWINYYLSHISQIYSEQSKYDEMMSSNFDVYFQTKENFYVGTFDNETKFKPLIHI